MRPGPSAARDRSPSATSPPRSRRSARRHRAAAWRRRARLSSCPFPAGLRTQSGAVLTALPLRRALLGERLQALAEVLRVEAGLAQLHEPSLYARGELDGYLPQRSHDLLVADKGERGVGGDLARHREDGVLELGGLHDAVEQPHVVGAVGVDVAAEEEQLAGIARAADLDELLEARVRV